MTPPFRERLLAVAQHYADAHVKEQGGNNRGPEVDHFLRVVDVPPGEPWCAAAVVTWACEAYLKSINDTTPTAEDFKHAKIWLGLNYFAPSPAVALIEANAKKRGIFWNKAWTPTPGSLVIYHFPTGSHIGVVVKDRGPTLDTIEGNTSDGNARDGDGVFARTRDKKYVAGYVDLGNQ